MMVSWCLTARGCVTDSISDARELCVCLCVTDDTYFTSDCHAINAIDYEGPQEWSEVAVRGDDVLYCTESQLLAHPSRWSVVRPAFVAADVGFGGQL